MFFTVRDKFRQALQLGDARQRRLYVLAVQFREVKQVLHALHKVIRCFIAVDLL